MGKIMKRCQVCDGPVVNGRCKLCGMPYRNDDELYHLNENRRDHYAHASWREKQMMREAEVPLPDRNRPTAVQRPAGQNAKRQPAVPLSREYPKSIPPKGAAAGQRPGQNNGKKEESSGSALFYFAILIIVFVIAYMHGC